MTQLSRCHGDIFYVKNFRFRLTRLLILLKKQAKLKTMNQMIEKIAFACFRFKFCSLSKVHPGDVLALLLLSWG